MTKKEYLVSDMEDMAALLNGCLRTLKKGEIDETAYQQLSAGMSALTFTLRLYFGEDPTAEQQIIILESDV